MIVDTVQRDVEIYGDIKEYKASIDPKNLEYIVTLLSSNLYSDPEQSFIREIVSNAWDSHVEAGTTNIPIIISFKEDEDCNSITIRDFGTGLSPERFEEIYRNIGSSTKRGSNEFIGGFGIGKYSALACSDTVYITSYYEGISYQYIMIKSGNSITINLLAKGPTEENNGVAVTIKNISNIERYYDALDYIIFFPNVYVDAPRYISVSNTTKIKRFTNFAAASTSIENKLLLGNVLYPCNKSLMPKDVVETLNRISYNGIVIKFDVGELNITPNRESIIYNPDTINKIADRVRAAKKELDETIIGLIAKDYTNIADYYDLLIEEIHYDPIEGAITPLSSYNKGYRTRVGSLNTSNLITYKGNDLSGNLRVIGGILNSIIPNLLGVVSSDRIYRNKLPYQEQERATIKKGSFILCNESRLSEYIKLFLRENYEGYSIIKGFTKDSLIDSITDPKRGYELPSSNLGTIISGIYEYIMSKTKVIDFKTDKSFLDFKEHILSDKSSTKPTEHIILHRCQRSYRIMTKFNTISSVVKYFNKLKQGVVLVYMDSPVDTIVNLAEIKNMAVFKAKKSVVDELIGMRLPCFVTPIELVHDPYITKIITVRDCFSCYTTRQNTLRLERLLYLVPPIYEKQLREVLEIDKVIRRNFQLALRLNIEAIDPYFKYLCEKFMFYINKYSEAIGDFHNLNVNVEAAVIMKTKAFRISSEAYFEMKHDKLINILCRK